MAEEHQLVARQKAFVLLQVFTGPNRRLQQSKLAKRFNKTILQSLGPIREGSEKVALDKEALEVIRDDLVQSGYLQRIKEGNAPFLQVTDKGAALLLSSPQYHSLKFSMTGEGLTSLLKGLEELLLGQKGMTTNGVNLFAAQAQMDSILADTLQAFKGLFAATQGRLLAVLGGASPTAVPPDALPSPALPKADVVVSGSPPQAVPPTEADLNEEILAAFDYLLREQYTQGSMVPIHAVRRRIAERLGEEAASHAVFDPAVQHLGKRGKLRLVSISDRRDVTDDEINASIPGANETFYYLKAVHEHAHA